MSLSLPGGGSCDARWYFTAAERPVVVALDGGPQDRVAWGALATEVSKDANLLIVDCGSRAERGERASGREPEEPMLGSGCSEEAASALGWVVKRGKVPPARVAFLYVFCDWRDALEGLSRTRGVPGAWIVAPGKFPGRVEFPGGRGREPGASLRGAFVEMFLACPDIDEDGEKAWDGFLREFGGRKQLFHGCSEGEVIDGILSEPGVLRTAGGLRSLYGRQVVDLVLDSHETAVLQSETVMKGKREYEGKAMECFARMDELALSIVVRKPVKGDIPVPEWLEIVASGGGVPVETHQVVLQRRLDEGEFRRRRGAGYERLPEHGGVEIRSDGTLLEARIAWEELGFESGDTVSLAIDASPKKVEDRERLISRIVKIP